ncbi:fluoride efflux transporter FluC [Rothia sp. P5766]|uniref:fluoride efflux transporter FluC n=1 Tax=Rothia sp. P5766 TaxID=3402656 RepID=UPI003AE7B390
MIALLIFCAGGLGAALRFVVDSYFKAYLCTRLPLGVFFINVTGSLFLGLLTGVITQNQASDLSEGLGLVLGAGFLGGYTTFSTALLEAVTHPGKAGPLILVLLQAVCASLAAALGLIVGGSLAI